MSARSQEKRASHAEKLLVDARSGETRRSRSAWRTGVGILDFPGAFHF